MTLYDPLRGRDRVLLIALLSKLYEEDDRPLDLDVLEAEIQIRTPRTVRKYVAALCSMGAARRSNPAPGKKARTIWPTVLGRLWWTEQLDQAPDLYAELEEYEANDLTPLDIDDDVEPY